MPNFLSQILTTTRDQAISAFAPVASNQLQRSLQGLVDGGAIQQTLSAGVNAFVPLINNTVAGGVLQNALNPIITDLGRANEVLPPRIPLTPISGRKPQSLRTEYAGSNAEGKEPYSEGDIKFFLLRADQTLPESGSEKPVPPVEPPFNIDQAESPLEAQTGGAGFLGRGLANPFTQLAVAVARNVAVSGTQRLVEKTPLRVIAPVVGPLTGLQIDRFIRSREERGQTDPQEVSSQDQVEGGSFSLSTLNPRPGLGPDAVARTFPFVFSPAASQDFFFNLNNTSFYPDLTTGPELSEGFEDNINISFGQVNNISSELSRIAPDVTTREQLAQKIAEGGITNFKGQNSYSGFSENALGIQGANQEDLIPKSWYFVVAPKEVTWKKESKASTVNTYGSNTPYVTYGTTTLRSLTLSGVLLEGFSDRKTVEANIVALESCMNMVMNTTLGYVAPYCWKLFSGGKNYGTFIIVNVDVTEVMRDSRGFATRATVDIQLQQVPEFQVNTGRDLASKAMTGEIKRNVERALIPPDNASQESRVSSKKGTGEDGTPSRPGGRPQPLNVRGTPPWQGVNSDGSAFEPLRGAGTGNLSEEAKQRITTPTR